MHAKFAKRIALVAHAKRKAHGVEAVSLWWRQAFGHLPQQEFSQVMAELAKIKR
jgi:hypothetical protein